MFKNGYSSLDMSPNLNRISFRFSSQNFKPKFCLLNRLPGPSWWRQKRRPAESGAPIDQGFAPQEGRFPQPPSDQIVFDPLVATKRNRRQLGEGTEEFDRESGLGAGPREE